MKPDFSEVHQEKQGSICTGYSKGNYKRIQKNVSSVKDTALEQGPEGLWKLLSLTLNTIIQL